MKRLSATDQSSTRIINLPSTPTADNDATSKTYVDTQVATKVTGTTKITVGTTAPTSPAVGDLWVDTN